MTPIVHRSFSVLFLISILPGFFYCKGLVRSSEHFIPTHKRELASGILKEPGVHGEMVISHQGRERTLIYYLPEKASRSYPLLVVLHGGGGNGYGIQEITGFSYYAKKYGFAVAYPDGYKFRWNDGRNLSFPADQENIDDIGFLRKIKEHFLKFADVDPHRVYLAGFSNGGFMALRAMCETKKTFRGYAVVQAGLTPQLAGTCQNPDRNSLLFIHGKRDRVVPPEGGEVKVEVFGRIFQMGRVLSQKEALEYFSGKFACSGQSQSRKPGILQIEYNNCKENSGIRSILWEKGDHSWPDGREGYSATKEILEYFQLY